MRISPSTWPTCCAGAATRPAPRKGLTGASDLALAATCRSERRALLTLDSGFGDLRRHSPAEHHGIMVLRLRNTSKPTALGMAGRVLSHLEDSSRSRGALWIVSEDDVRMLVVKDTGGSRDEAVRAVRELVADDSVVAIIGPTFSSSTVAAGPVANAAACQS